MCDSGECKASSPEQLGYTMALDGPLKHTQPCRHLVAFVERVDSECFDHLRVATATPYPFYLELYTYICSYSHAISIKLFFQNQHVARGGRTKIQSICRKASLGFYTFSTLAHTAMIYRPLHMAQRPSREVRRRVGYIRSQSNHCGPASLLALCTPRERSTGRTVAVAAAEVQMGLV